MFGTRKGYLVNPPPRHPELCARLLGDPHLPRRQFIRTSGGLFLALAAPSVVACTGDAETDAELVRLSVALLVAVVERSLSDEVNGDVVFQNDDNEPTAFRSRYNLLEDFGTQQQADEASYDYEVAPGREMFGWGGLYPRALGEHLVRLLIPGAQYDSDPFRIGG